MTVSKLCRWLIATIGVSAMSNLEEYNAKCDAHQAIGFGVRQFGQISDEAILKLYPRDADLQHKELPVLQALKKLTSCREKLRVFEQRVNNSSMPVHERLSRQSEITNASLALAQLAAFFDCAFKEDS
jgi:hypothetical protein